MLFPALVFLVSLGALLAATYTDLKKRIVPNRLSLPLIAGGILLNLGYAAFTGNWLIAAFSVIAAGYMFAFSYGLYRIGAWAGGDVKLFTALAALNPLNPFIAGKLGIVSITAFQPVGIPLFPITLFIFTLLAMFPVAVFITLKRSLVQRDAFIRLLRDLLILVLASAALIWLSGTEFAMAALLLAFPIVYFVLNLMLACRVFLRKSIKITEMEEGMIPAEKIIARGNKIERKYSEGMKSFINYIRHYKIAGQAETGKARVLADSARARGVSQEELSELRKLVKQGKLEDRISVKESAPMVPAILVAYVALNLVGDVLWQIVGLDGLLLG